MFNIIFLSLLLIFSCSSSVESSGTWSGPGEFTAVSIFTQNMPAQESKWISPPHIRICDFSPVSVDRVNEAAQWWKDRGYLFSGVSEGGIWGGCKKGKISGSITISLSGQSFNFSNHLGETKIYHTQSGAILQANIEISHDSGDKDRVLEHEIGHALGWGHYRKHGHMMHPSYDMGGTNDDHIRHDL